ncbi:MAG: ThuA domain-containing protein [Planctomycetia bacterium]|nr:ThuA domain-containing protein [Planctomycetia bacterium]
MKNVHRSPQFLVVVGLAMLVGLAQGTAACGDDAAPKRLLLLGQKPDGHPPGTHEYMRGQRILQQVLERVPGLKVEVVQADGDWTEGPELLGKVDGVVLFVSEGAKWISADARRYEAFVKAAQRGAGLTGIHWGIGTKDAANIEPFVKLFGACHGGPDRKYQVVETEVALPVAEHPICAGLKPFRIHEEFYFALKRPTDGSARLLPIATIRIAAADQQPEEQMVGWAYDRPDRGRSFGFTGLHYHENWKREEYRRLLAQGVLWTMKLPLPKTGLDVNVSEEFLK